MAAQIDEAHPFTSECGGVGYSSNKLLFGLVAYYERTGDRRSLEAARGMVEFTLARETPFREWLASKNIFYNAFAFNQLDNGMFGLSHLRRSGSTSE